MKNWSLYLFIFSTLNAFTQEGRTLRFECGTSLDYLTLITRTQNTDVDYFTSKYSNGICPVISFKNRVLIYKWFLAFDPGYGIVSEKQQIVFGNDFDPIIEHEVRHTIHHWQLGYGLGRKMDFSEKLGMTIEFGATTFGFFSRFGIPSKDLSGNFVSEYVDDDDHWQGTSSIATYNYTISYAGLVRLTPWIRAGITRKIISKNSRSRSLEFGLSYFIKRMQYENFIVIQSGNYTAIANSRSTSHGVGMYVNLLF